MHKPLGSLALLATLVAAPQARAQVPALDTLGRASLTSGFPTMAVAVEGDYAYAVNSSLAVIDVRDLAAPVVLGTAPTSYTGSETSVLVHGGYAYVVNGSTLDIFDVATPSSPSRVGRFNSSARALAASWPYLFLGDTLMNPDMTNCPGCGPTYGGIQVMDATNPISPVPVARLPLNGTPRRMALSGTKLYVAEFESGRFKVIDVSQPTAPTQIASLVFANYTYGLAVAGSYAYVTTHGTECDDYCWPGPGDIHVIDLRYPACPREIATVHRSGPSEAIAADANALYVIEYNGVYTLDVTNPSAPVEVALNGLGQDLLRPAIARGAVFVPERGDVVVLRAYQPSDLPPGGVCLP